MPLGSYTADPRNVGQPLDTVSGGFAAREIRTLKGLVLDLERDAPPATAGAGNAYTVVSFSDVLVTGDIYVVRANRANTGAATLIPGTGSAIAITNIDGSALLANQIKANQVLWLYKTGTDLHLLNKSQVSATSTVEGIILVNNTLTSTETEQALSAAQGKTLKDLLDNTISELNVEEAALVTHKSSDDHDGRYYTETEVDGLLATKAALAGSASQVFEVDAPSSADHAIPRDFLGTESVAGSARLATAAEIIAGVAVNRVVNVANLVTALADASSALKLNSSNLAPLLLGDNAIAQVKLERDADSASGTIYRQRMTRAGNIRVALTGQRGTGTTIATVSVLKNGVVQGGTYNVPLFNTYGSGYSLRDITVAVGDLITIAVSLVNGSGTGLIGGAAAVCVANPVGETYLPYADIVWTDQLTSL